MATTSTRNGKIICGLCSTYINEVEYRAHVVDCGVVKKCALCGKNVSNLTEHYEKCTGGDNRTNVSYTNRQQSPVSQNQPYQPVYSPNRKNTRKCALCSAMVNENDYADHMDTCTVRSSMASANTRNTKRCALCSVMINENDYADHMDTCTVRSLMASANIKNTKRCGACSKEIDVANYSKHVNGCFNSGSIKPNNTKECIICFKPIAETEYIKHVDACLSGSSSTSKSPKPIIEHNGKSCFTCSSAINLSKSSSHTIPCQSRHMYCLKCLRNSMNEYIQSNTPPVCHSNLCDYELSRYDAACMPLEENFIQRLLTSVKNTQRTQCPVCLFYVDFNTMADFQRHVASCNTENLVPCEYCRCPYNKHRLDEHVRQCRDIPRSQQQKTLIDFLLPRTKYPLTEPQIRVFIEYRQQNRMPLDPHSIVDTLAEFGTVFPFDVPMLDCGLCMETCTYNDIFVFGCEQSHKLCYGCFETSCTTQMDANDVLKCAECSYQLLDGEIKQLKVPNDRKKQFLDYQTQKTFSLYSDGTQGVIKCPNQGCKWVAEMHNPNDCFSVTCRACKHVFCSLCSQHPHFRITCQQIPEITQRWFFWCNTERGNYWRARAQQDANFKAQLDDYERQKTANEQRNTELRHRYDELLADENYKAQNCRLCPKCQRVVQHLEGCDSMVCGRNYHGGDQQSGCGQSFNWSQAQPYAPVGNTGPQQIRNNLPPPEEQKAVIHQDIYCASCQNELQGIRFDCVHCESLTFCEKCEQKATLEHSNQIRDQHKQQHVFQLISRPIN